MSLEQLGRLEVDSLGSIVGHAVVADQIKRTPELTQRSELVLLDHVPHGGEVHGLLDDGGVPGRQGVADRVGEEVVDILLLQHN